MSKLVRSAGVGVVATICDLATLVILVRGLGLAPTVANLPALAVGVLVQFAGNKWFAFESAARGRTLAAQGIKFAVVEAGALFWNALAFHVLVTATQLPNPLARLAGSS
jgi:putative flippase GtrA